MSEVAEQEKFTEIGLNDWQFNAGVVGFLNILDKANKLDLVKIGAQKISFDPKVFDDFETDYFNYFIETYQKTLSWSKIVAYQETIDYFEEDNFEQFDEKNIEVLNTYIRDVAKKNIKSKSYKAAYQLIESDVDIMELGANLKTIPKIKSKEKFADVKEQILNEVKDRFSQIKKIIAYFENEQAKKYIRAKNVLYTVIKNGWDGVSALNPQTKEPNLYIDFRDYFVEPCLNYLEADKTKYKFNCAVTNQPIKNLDEVFSFLVQTGYDTKRKASHGWEFANDLAISPICKFIYACVPAGINYVYGQGIFVNVNDSVESLWNTNRKFRYQLFENNQKEIREVNAYVSLIQILEQIQSDSVKYELADIQIVSYENETYRFTILPKRILRVFHQANTNLMHLIRASWNVNGQYENMYQVTVKRLMNSENLFTLIHRLLLYKATGVSNTYYGMFHIEQLLTINQKFLGGIDKMEELSQDELSKIRSSGWYFKQGYENSRKVDGIVYKLLNALKISNRDAFMDVILNCYAYLDKQVPKSMIQIFESDERFKTIGYTFVSGIIGENTKNEKGETK